MVIPILMTAAKPLSMNITTATALATSPPCAGGPTLLNIQMTATASCSEIPESDPKDPVAAGAQAGCPVEAGSLTKALTAVPTEASAPAIATASITAKEAKENPHTAAEEVPSHTGLHTK